MESVLWEISYVNLLMLLATIPKYEPDTDKKEVEKEKPVGSEETSFQDIFKK